MGTLYLHIGTPKTGTTMIQHFLSDNRDVLLKSGYSFPDFGMRFEGIGVNRNAHFMIQRYFDENGNRMPQSEQEVRQEGYRILFQELNEHENVVLSDESIWNNYDRLGTDFWSELVGWLTKEGHKLRVIVYLRRQDIFVQSYWAQRVKLSSKQPFQDFLAEEPWEKCHMYYDRALDKIAHVVGEENMVVRVFEKSSFLTYQGEPSLVADFMDAIGLRYTEEYAIAKQEMNVGIGGEYLEAKRILNDLPELSGKASFLIPLIYRTEEEGEQRSGYDRVAGFNPGQNIELLEKFAQSNRNVAIKYLHREDGVLFQEEVREAGAAKPYSSKELVLACGKMLLAQQEELAQLQERYKSLQKQRREGIFIRSLRYVKRFLMSLFQRRNYSF